MLAAKRVGTLMVALVASGGANVGHAQQQVPLRSLVEDRRILSSDSSIESSLTRVSSLTLLSDGSVVSFHGRPISWMQGVPVVGGSGGTVTENIIRSYDSTGRFLRVVGRSGSGPGEFDGLGHGGSVGSVIWAYDFRNRRVTWFSRDGQVLKIVSLRSGGAGPQANLLGLLSANRRLLVQRFEGSSMGRGMRAVDAESILYSVEDSVGTPISRLFVHTPKFKTIEALIEGLRWRQSQDLAGTVLIAISDGGEHLFIASDASLWGGQPAQVRLQRLSANNQLETTMLQFPPRRVPADYLDQRIASLRVDAKSATAMKAVMKTDLYVPDVFPVLRDLKAGRDGSVWIKDVHDADIWWVVFGGKPQFRTRVPNGVAIMTVSRTTAWGVGEDANGVPRLIRYSIVPPSPQ